MLGTTTNQWNFIHSKYCLLYQVIFKYMFELSMFSLCCFFLSIFFRTKREKEDWLESLFEAIKELYQKKSSLKLGREVLRPPDAEIGKRQPHLLKLDAIHKCMECSQPFSMMRKKYNCRACGVVSIYIF